jgi:hypothetical protein
MAQPWFLTLSRAVVGLVTLVYITPFAARMLFLQLRYPFDLLDFTFGVVAATLALLGWWFALRGGNPTSRRRIKCALLGGLIGFAMGFAGGFFGPMIFKPQANQGPLLGIFFTGPLAFPLGLLGGLLYGRKRANPANP